MEKSINKDSFILFKEHEEIFIQLSKEQAGELILAIFEYERTEIVPELEFCIKLAFTPIRQSLDRSREKYKEVCKKNSLNAQKRWGNKNATADNRKKQNTKNADSEHDSEYEHDSENILEELEDEKNSDFKIWGKYENVYLSRVQYQSLLTEILNENALLVIIEDFSQKVAEGKEPAFDGKQNHFARLRAFWDFRRKNPEKFTEEFKKTTYKKIDKSKINFD